MEEIIEMLQAVFCNPGEFEHKYSDTSSVIFTIRTEMNYPQVEGEITDSIPDVSITFNLSLDDSSTAPGISVSCPSLSQQDLKCIQTKLRELAADQLGSSCMVMDLVMWVKNEAAKLVPRNTQVSSLPEMKQTGGTLLLQLDHMRAKAKYTRTIVKWCEELDLTGKLLFYHRFIFILLQGEQSSLKEYLHRQRTVCVDVDTSGRDCKERKMDILYQGAATKRFSDFAVRECESLNNLEMELANEESSGVFHTIIAPLISRTMR